MDAQKTFFILGSLCQWKAEIFKSFGGSPMDLKGHCDWLQLACEIYNFFWIDLSEFILKGNLEHKDSRPVVTGCAGCAMMSLGYLKFYPKRTKEFEFTTTVPQFELFLFVFWED